MAGSPLASAEADDDGLQVSDPLPTVDFMLFKVAGCDRIAAVPFVESSTVMILLASILGVLVMILMVFWGATRTLARIERRLAELQSRDGVGEERLSAAEHAAGGAFETFLSEDPARRQLPKKERFAAYRKWRQEKGLNWSNPQ